MIPQPPISPLFPYTTLFRSCESPAAVEILQNCGVQIQQLKKQLRAMIKKNCPQISTEQIGVYGGFETWQPEFTLACHRLRSEEHTSELQSQFHLVCRLLLEK